MTPRMTVTQAIEHNKHLSTMINDLTLLLDMWIDGYPFDEDHLKKQKTLVDIACFMIGKPRTVDEMKEFIKNEIPNKNIKPH